MYIHSFVNKNLRVAKYSMGYTLLCGYVHMYTTHFPSKQNTTPKVMVNMKYYLPWFSQIIQSVIYQFVCVLSSIP